VDDRALFDPGPLRAGRTANRLDHLLDQEFDAGSPPHIREDPHVFETHQGPHDLDRVSKDEGASGTLAHTTTLEHLRQFRGDLRQGATPLRSEETHNDEKCSGGETRTLNLAGALEQGEYQHPLE